MSTGTEQPRNALSTNEVSVYVIDRSAKERVSRSGAHPTTGPTRKGGPSRRGCHHPGGTRPTARLPCTSCQRQWCRTWSTGRCGVEQNAFSTQTSAGVRSIDEGGREQLRTMHALRKRENVPQNGELVPIKYNSVSCCTEQNRRAK